MRLLTSRLLAPLTLALAAAPLALRDIGGAEEIGGPPSLGLTRQ